jgi:anti-sigma28 factor (negative regulator of flagellin synthesis)
MKIDPANVLAPGTVATGIAASEPSRIEKTNPTDSTTEVSSVGRSTDQVQLSNFLGSLRQAALAADDNVTPERAAHLDKLASQVANGDYHIDAKVVSSKIIDDTLRGIG